MAFSIDTATPFGERVERRLHDETIGWLTTVSLSGAPVPIPIWFLWEGSSVLMYSRPKTPKLRNIAANRRVSLHLGTDDEGIDVVILACHARVAPAEPPADANRAYVAKYERYMAKMDWTPATFATGFSVAVRLEPQRLRGQ